MGVVSLSLSVCVFFFFLDSSVCEREQSPACVNFAAYEPEQDPFQTRAHGGTRAEMRFCAQNCWIEV